MVGLSKTNCPSAMSMRKPNSALKATNRHPLAEMKFQPQLSSMKGRPSSLDPHPCPDKVVHLTINLPTELILDILTYLCYQGPEHAAAALHVSRHFQRSLERHFKYELNSTHLETINAVSKIEGRPLKLTRLDIDLTAKIETMSCIDDILNHLSQFDVKVSEVTFKNLFSTAHIRPVPLKSSLAKSIKSLSCIEAYVGTVDYNYPHYFRRRRRTWSPYSLEFKRAYPDLKSSLGQMSFSSCEEVWWEFSSQDRDDKVYHTHPISFPALQHAYIVIPKKMNFHETDSVFSRFVDSHPFPSTVKIALIIRQQGKWPTEFEKALKICVLGRIDQGIKE